MKHLTRSVFFLGLSSLALTGCVNGFWWGAKLPEGVIKPSIKPYEPPVTAPVSAITPEPYVPDPPNTIINAITGQRETTDGKLLRGGATAIAEVMVNAEGQLVDAKTGLPLGYHKDPVTGLLLNDKGEVLKNDSIQNANIGEKVAAPSNLLPASALKAAPASDPNAAVKTAENLRITEIDAGNTVFVETKGLKPETEYIGVLTWPNGTKTTQPLKSTAGGNISGPQGNFIEFAHSGFYNADMTPGEAGIVTGDFKLDIVEKGDGTIAQTINYTVRPRPIIFAVNEASTARTVFFSDRADQVFLHGEGFPANTPVSVWVIRQNCNRFNPLVDGISMEDKVLDNLKNLRFRTNDKGVFDTQIMAWPRREKVDESLVVVGKYFNSDSKYIAAEDVAITDHPTFVIKPGGDYFNAIDPASIIRAPAP